jgi:eukaryotic-like serine/threonine-protein kinase
VTDQLVGKTLGRYEVTALVGRGGMATVYRAVDPALKRDVAIKVMHPHLAADPAFVGRFRHEAQAVAALRHPNIVNVFDFGNEGEQYFMVMEYIDGPTLASLLGATSAADAEAQLAPAPRPGLSTGEILRVFLPLCSAIDYATSRGMIHRDIKPANILLSREREPFLTDYGIAKIMSATSFTASGMVMGSAHYMSPEQVQGFPTDHRTDIYSLGIVLFVALAGRVPYDADTTASILAQHLSAPVPFARNLNPGLPEEVQAVVEKALAKEPDARYQRAGDLAAALYAALTSSPAAFPASRAAPQPGMIVPGVLAPTVVSSRPPVQPSYSTPPASQPPRSQTAPPSTPQSRLPGQPPADQPYHQMGGGYAPTRIDRAVTPPMSGMVPAAPPPMTRVPSMPGGAPPGAGPRAASPMSPAPVMPGPPAWQQPIMWPGTMPVAPKKSRKGWVVGGVLGLVVIVAAVVAAVLLSKGSDETTTTIPAAVSTTVNAEANRLITDGNTLAESGKLDEAIAKYQAALEASPQDDRAHTLLGMMYYLHGGYGSEQAETQLQSATEANSGNAQAWAFLGLARLDRALNEGSDLGPAEAACRKAIELDADNGEAHAFLARVLASAGVKEEALAEMKKGLDLAPDDAWVLSSAGATEDALGDGGAAIPYHQQAVDKQPNWATFAGLLGESLYGAGRYDEAIESYQSVIDLAQGQEGWGYTQMGIAQWKNGDSTSAVTNLKQALTLSDQNDMAHWAIGAVWDEQEDYSAALPHLQRAVDLVPGSAGYQAWLGDCLYCMESYEESRKAVDAALKLDPNYDWAKQLSESLKEKGY